MALFTYDKDNLLALYEDILQVVKLDSYSVYILNIIQERRILKDNIEYDWS
jgi:hypothetical protein